MHIKSLAEKKGSYMMFTYRSSLSPFPNLTSPFQPGFCYSLTRHWIFLSRTPNSNKNLIYFFVCILQELFLSSSWPDRSIFSLEVPSHHTLLISYGFVLFVPTSKDCIPQGLVLSPLLFPCRILAPRKSCPPAWMRFKYH